MKTKQVIVVAYDSSWKAEFQRIKLHLEQALADSVAAIEHVGSTSVEGLAAKPVIDIDVVLKQRDDFLHIRSLLERLGYRHEGDLGIKDREAFGYTEKPELMKHHLYVCPPDSQELRRHLAFRDYLRTHPDDRDKYSAIKLQGAKEHPADIDRYIENKGPFIAEIYQKIGL